MKPKIWFVIIMTLVLVLFSLILVKAVSADPDWGKPEWSGFTTYTIKACWADEKRPELGVSSDLPGIVWFESGEALPMTWDGNFTWTLTYPCEVGSVVRIKEAWLRTEPHEYVGYLPAVEYTCSNGYDVRFPEILHQVETVED